MKRHASIAAVLLCSLNPLAAHAADQWGGSVSLASDYVFRGLSQTDGEPAVQADLNWHRDDAWLAGLWASTVDVNPGPGPTLELNAYAGHNWRLARHWQAKLMAVHYVYPNDTPQLRWDYDELIASLALRDRLIATVAWSPNASGFADGRIVTDRSATSYELAAHLPWRQAWVATAGVGYYDLSDLFSRSYTFWSCGVTYHAAPWQFSLARFGTSGQATTLYGNAPTHDRWSLGVQWRFRSAAR